jgi:hypothetical protein
MSKKSIQKRLARALLEGGEFAEALYEYELAEHVDEYLQSKKRDGDLYFFAVTEHSGEVAMLAIDENNILHINEMARLSLQAFWPNTYIPNITRLLPDMAEQLDLGFLYSAGIKQVDDKNLGKWTSRLFSIFGKKGR